MERSAGILLPVFSLPGPYGIGSLGREARAFAEFLHNAGQRWWQVLPVGPTGAGNSPYTSESTFAGNPLLIDLEDLRDRGLLTEAELSAARVPEGAPIDYAALYESREPLLRRAFSRLDGAEVLAGNRRLLEEGGVDVSALAEQADRLAAQGQTPMYFARDGRLLGLISVADPVKDTSAAAIAKMKELGIRTVLLTGDNRAAADHIGALVGVDEVIAEVLPEEKAGVVERLQAQGRTVMMVGDGINDAPALTAATVGCAIGSGSDIAIESADIVLMRSDLQDVPRAIRLSRLTLRDIKQNLFWAFCYNTIGIPIAAGLLFAFGGPLLSPMFAGAAMSLSSVCVVGNALRLGRAKL